MWSCRVLLGAVALYACTAFPSLADDFALVLTNRDYDRLSDAGDAARHDGFRTVLEQAGYRVFAGQDLDARGQARRATEFSQTLRAAQVDRVIVVLAGHIVDGAGDSWLLASDSGAANALNVGQYALSIGAITNLLGDYAGKGLLVLTPSVRNVGLGPGVARGTDQVSLPQGVTLLNARADRALSLVSGKVLTGQPLATVAAESAGMASWSGYIPDLPLGGSVKGGGQGRELSDDTYWLAASDLDTVESYRAYLSRFPRGLYANEARRRIGDIEDRPMREAQSAERALNLSREDRRDIQRDLSLLGYDTRGIDGVFGPGTRAAIAAYQRNKGLPETGYVTGNLISMLSREAQFRARQLEEEERARRAEEERRDREYWRSVGDRNGEDGLRQYLRRYPDGIFADHARRRLAEIEDRRRTEADQQMRDAWDRARSIDTVQAYRAFIRRYPRSGLVGAAEDRIAELEEAERNREQIERDKAQEAIIASTPAIRLLVEQNLIVHGYQPGKVDGQFDENTRVALRQFQNAIGLVATGYVSQETLIRLMVPVVKN